MSRGDPGRKGRPRERKRVEISLWSSERFRVCGRG